MALTLADEFKSIAHLDEILHRDEELYARARPALAPYLLTHLMLSPVYVGLPWLAVMIGNGVAIGLTLILACLALGLVLSIQITDYQTRDILLTNQRLIFRRGLWHRYLIDVPLYKIESISAFQSFLGRLFNYGRLTVTGSGALCEASFLLARPGHLRSAILKRANLLSA